MLFRNQTRFNQELEDILPRLYRLAYSWCHNRELAEDLVQEASAKALKARHQLQDINGFDKWIFKILINHWRNYISREKQMSNIDDLVLEDNNCPQTVYERQHLTDYVKQAVSSLPVGQRQALSLIDLEGCSYAEVSELLDVPIGTVMSRLCRARKSLGQLLLETPVTNQTDSVLRRIK